MNVVETELCSGEGQHALARTRQLLAAAERAEGDGRGILLAEVVELNMCLADALVPPHVGRGVAVEDLRRVAFLALVEAVDGYGTSRAGVDFQTVAAAVITRELDERVREQCAIGRS